MNAVTPLKILHTAANNATPGVWGILSVTSSVSVRAVVNLNGGGTSRNIVCKLTPSAWRPYDEMRRDANFIALANPATIITLLDRLEAAEARGRHLKQSLPRFGVSKSLWATFMIINSLICWKGMRRLLNLTRHSMKPSSYSLQRLSRL